MSGTERGGGRGERRKVPLAGVLERNIEAVIARRRAEAEAQRPKDRLAAGIGRFAGSMTFVAIHAAIFGAWVLVNVGILPGPRFDPDFVKLATAASVEAIFISTFVLVTQNRMAALADKRADLDLQISLLTEHELTRLIRLADAIAQKLGVEAPILDELEELKRDVPPEGVLDHIERAEGGPGGGPPI